MIIYEENEKLICPAGNFNAICVGVYDLGIQPSKNGWASKRKVAICYEIDKKIKDGTLAGQPYRLSRIVSTSLNKKSVLSEMLVSWFGRDPAANTNGKRAFDFSSLIGKPCTISVAHHTKDGDTHAVIHSVSSHMEGMKVLESDYDPYGPAPEWIERIRSQRTNQHEPVSDAKRPEALENPGVPDQSDAEDDESDWLDRSDNGSNSVFC